MNENKSLTIYGAGSLGAEIARQWKAQYPDRSVIGVTQSDHKHKALRDLGVEPYLADAERPKSRLMIIAIPPMGAYQKALQAALKSWDAEEGRLLLISSSGIYTEDRGGVVDETSAVDESSLQRAGEREILAAGGMILRLAGIYDEGRGPPRVVRQRGRMSGPSEGYLNLIHTEDAASLSLAALRAGQAGSIYLGCDDEPLTRRAFVERAIAAPESIEFAEGPSRGKRCQNSQTRKALGWSPRFPAFQPLNRL